MNIILLHLSDSHIKNNCQILSRHSAIAATLRPLLSLTRRVLVVYTGDIVNSGKMDEFVMASTFLTNLMEDISKDFSGPIEIITVPGNHDGDFKNSKTTRTRLINGIRSEQNPQIDSDFICECTEPLENYYKFNDSLGASGKTFSDKLWAEYRYIIGEKALRFSAMNASWISTVPESKAELIFPIEHYASHQEDSASINILLMHHPLNWYAQASYHPLREMVKAHYQLVMSGHEHTAATNIIADQEQQSSVYFEASALENGELSSFSVLLLDLNSETVAQETFSWNGELYQPENGTAVWDRIIQIPKCRHPKGFHLTERAKAWLESLDATFTHPMQEVIQLSDVFVYPDLQELNGNSDGPESISASELLLPKEKNKKVLIYGDEQYGKTSLLKHLVAQYLNSAQKPIMFDAKDAAGNPEQFRRVIDRVVTEQYGESSTVKYAQGPIEEKIALVDNLEEIGARGDVLARVMRNLEGQFGHIIITANERYEVSVMSSKESVAALSNFSEYRMQGFGYKLRHDLVRRWYQIGNQLCEESYEAKVQAADQTINGVLSKGLVPMTAFNTLVLLQTVEVNERGSLANAGTAQYYEYMFRHSLTAAKVRADEFDEIQSYLVYLAWEFFKHRQKTISTDAILQFNHWFSEKIHPTEPLVRLKLLEDTKILTRRNGGYGFAYPYLEYFFVAKYLATHCEDQPELKETIKRLCRHIYLKENANIVLFLTHHIHHNWVVQEIADLLSAILSEIPMLRLEDDAAVLNTWVSENAKILVDTTNVVKNNRDARESNDKAAKLPENLPDHEVSSIGELDKFTQLNLLFKTSEILGQVLKGRYGSIVKEVKTDLVRRLFDAPLRGVNFFNSIINTAPEAVLLEVTSRLQKNFPTIARDKVDRVAKRFLFSTIGAVADAFISRQGEIIGSPKLTQIIDHVTQADGGLSYQIVSVASKLSYPGTPPIDQIKDLAVTIEKNYFGYKLLQGLVARHLYMFYLPHGDKTRLAAAVGIDVRTQRDIEMKSQTTKKLPSQTNQKHPAGLFLRLQNSFLLNNKASIEYIKNMYDSKKEKNKL